MTKKPVKIRGNALTAVGRVALLNPFPLFHIAVKARQAFMMPSAATKNGRCYPAEVASGDDLKAGH